MVLNDVIKVVARGVLLGQEVRNIFYYLVTQIDTGITILDFLVDFGTQIMDNIHPVQAADMSWYELQGDNVTDGIGSDVYSYSALGSDAGSGPVLPSYVAAGVSLEVGSRITRPGGKRIAGVGEARVTDNGVTLRAIFTTTMLAALSADVDVVNPSLLTATLQPVVVGRTITGGLDLTKINPVVNATISPFITTQNTRKRTQ